MVTSWPPSGVPGRLMSDWSISARPAWECQRHSTVALVERFQADVHSRQDAGEIDPRNVHRYESAPKH